MSLFSDWGTQSWSEDLDAARAQAEAWLEQTVEGRAWSDYWRDTVLVFIGQAYDATNGWFSNDIVGFWQGLAAAMGAHSKALRDSGNTTAIPAGWDKLAASYAQAGGATLTVEAAREQGSVSTVVGGTVTQTAADIQAGAQAGVKPVLFGLGVAAVAWLAWKMR